jgi:hypothetical protein
MVSFSKKNASTDHPKDTRSAASVIRQLSFCLRGSVLQRALILASTITTPRRSQPNKTVKKNEELTSTTTVDTR